MAETYGKLAEAIRKTPVMAYVPMLWDIAIGFLLARYDSIWKLKVKRHKLS